ncbi:MAG: hypothetical protein AAF928_12880 [Myxococcota bacterium]
MAVSPLPSSTSALPSAWRDRIRPGGGGASNDATPALSTLTGSTLAAVAGHAAHSATEEKDDVLPLGIRALDAALPDGGLPRRGVVELCAPGGLGRLTHLALAACRAGQREDPTPGADLAWCAWIDPTGTLYAPGVAQRGVAPSRLLVVRPEPEDTARVAVRLVGSGVFSVVIIDRSPLPGVATGCGDEPLAARPSARPWGSTGHRWRQNRWALAVRRLALASERHACTILLLSDLEQARRAPLPTRMRLELSRPHADRLRIHVAKERRGRLVPPFELPLAALRTSESAGAVSAGAVSVGPVSFRPVSADPVAPRPITADPVAPCPTLAGHLSADPVSFRPMSAGSVASCPGSAPLDLVRARDAGGSTGVATG